jgi:hypothetical protein
MREIGRRIALELRNRYSFTREARMSARKQLQAFRYRDIPVAGKDDAGVRLADRIHRGVPSSVGKIGASELRGLRHFLRLVVSFPKYPTWVRDELLLGPGVFPTDPKALDAFHATYLTALAQVDMIGIWYQQDEDVVVRRNCRSDVEPVSVALLDPISLDRPWTEELRGKKVLVVSPFAASVERQYARRRDVWRAKPSILPDFELKTLRCPLSPALVPPVDRTWFATLDRLAEAVAAIDFDVMLVGAGAYSLPLCAEAKRLGRIGVHLGGTTQILFGILGGRWNGNELVERYANEAWVRPSGDEAPTSRHLVEDGCYW